MELNRKSFGSFSGPRQASNPSFTPIFSINVLRKAGINSQEALEYANNKFTKRYNYSEILAQKENKNFAEVPLEEKHRYWLKSKKIKL